MHLNVRKKLHQKELVHNKPAEELQHVACRTGHVLHLPVHGMEKRHLNVSKKLHQKEIIHNKSAEELQQVACRTGHVLHLPVHQTEKCLY